MDTLQRLLHDKIASRASTLWIICWVLSGLLNLKFDGIIYFFYVCISPLFALVLVVRTITILKRKNS